MQRLFSSFADGWPGVGLLLQRLVTGFLLFRFGFLDLTGPTSSPAMLPSILSACAGVLLMVGLWTPVVGTLIAVLQVWLAITQVNDPWIAVVLATFGATAAMIGPGAWSVDARLFGRRHIET
ncbi:hypothetical protein Acid345_2444 [Candidatus Koribacter versatilis Ellin345]|uniref:DoxX n=1 Tax=Koribacter versatilis (strain Ellin345) TaxID=204669 RepID=Q1INV5_KORVE|nr:hypothetical protein [Candidatus Koribacter versatilis]ABF41445.1 hypothetical protein Acid345_2444 [Candidatus Koribacter versatilis Ellin345]